MYVPFFCFLLAFGRRAHISLSLGAASTTQSAGSIRQEEATMTLAMRLNVLAAIFSFAFLTAIVIFL
jgi:hypothetical protein